jgi:hypothetical protein
MPTRIPHGAVCACGNAEVGWPQVEAAPGHKFSLTPYFSIIIGVTLSVLLCLLLSFVKRGVRSRRLRCAAPLLRCTVQRPALPSTL